MTHNAGLPATLRLQVQQLCDGLTAALGPTIGVVIHGSVALADYRDGHSDLDVLVFVDGQCTPAQQRAVAQLMLEVSTHPAPLELSVIDRSLLSAWVHPAPFYFHYSETWRQSTLQALADSTHDWCVIRPDPDLTAHMAVAHTHGIWVHGSGRIPQPSRAHAFAAVWYDIAEAETQVVDDPVYVVLNLCRTRHWLTSGEVLSKSAGGRAMLPQLDGEAYAVVSDVLAMRAGDTVVLPANDVLQRVAQQLLDDIKRLRPRDDM